MSDAVAAPAAPDTTAPASTESPKAPQTPDFRATKHKYKANGQEIEVDYDELLRRASSADGAEYARQEAAKLKRQQEERKRKLSDPEYDPRQDLVSEIGLDKLTKLAEDLLWEQYQYDALPDHEKKLREKDKELKRLQEEKEQREASSKKEAEARKMQEATARIDNLLAEAIEDAKAQGMSAAEMETAVEDLLDEYLTYLEAIEADVEAGGQRPTEELSHKEVLKRIQSRYDERSAAYIKKLSPDQLRKMLTKEQISALRQAEIASLHGGHIPSSGTAPQPKTESIFAAKKPAADSRRMRSNDAFAKLDEKILGKKGHNQ